MAAPPPGPPPGADNFAAELAAFQKLKTQAQQQKDSSTKSGRGTLRGEGVDMDCEEGEVLDEEEEPELDQPLPDILNTISQKVRLFFSFSFSILHPGSLKSIKPQ